MNTLIAKIRTREDDRGSIVLWTVIAAFGLLICLGLVVDGGGKLHARQQAQLVAEEAARAAGQAVITPLATRGTAVMVNPATAMIEAQKYLSATDIKGVVAATGPNTLLITTTTRYTPKVLGLIGLGEQTVVGTAHVNLNRTNTQAGGAP